MFALCSGMNWAHLPVAGGLYDQHPDLLDAFRIIFAAQAKHDAEERKREEQERKQTMAQQRSGGGRRPRTSSRR